MSINRSALIEITSIVQLVEETYQVVGTVTDPSGNFSVFDFAAGDVIFDSGLLGDFRWTITKINSASGDTLDCNVRWDDAGDHPIPGSGPAAGVGAICSVNEFGMAFAPTINVGEAHGYTERLASNIKNMDISRIGDFESDKEEELLFDLLGETDWADDLIFDIFRDESKRSSLDSYVNKAFIHNHLLKSGKNASTVYGWTSKEYVLSQNVSRIAVTSEYELLGGDLVIRVSVDGGSNYNTILDTGISLDELNNEFVVPAAGSNIVVQIEFETDGSGTGGFMKFFGLILGV